MNLLSEFLSMWNESLRKITTVQHHTDLKPDSHPSFRHFYPAELKRRVRKKQETDRTLKEDVIRPGMSERVSPGVLASRERQKNAFLCRLQQAQRDDRTGYILFATDREVHSLLGRCKHFLFNQMQK